jgi:hypothetical protein
LCELVLKILDAFASCLGWRDGGFKLSEGHAAKRFRGREFLPGVEGSILSSIFRGVTLGIRKDPLYARPRMG